MAEGLDKLLHALRVVFDTKADAQELIPGSLGTYDASGNKIIKVPGRADMVYVSVRGKISERIEAFNDKVYLQWGLPVLLYRDPLAPRYYKIVGRDTGKYQDWNSAGLVPHGDQHSFSGDTTDGRDVVFIYRRQLVQPLLCRPQSAPNMTVYVEADYYYWGGSFVRFPGGSSESLTPYKPASGGQMVFVLVYLDGGTNSVKVIRGDEFSSIFPPADTLSKIPNLNPSIGIPLGAVVLTSTTTKINWDDIYDIRALINVSSNAIPARHHLDPSFGSHSGSLSADDVSVADSPGNWFASDAEGVFAEIGNTGVRQIADAFVNYPKRQRIRFLGAVAVQDNVAQNSTDVSITGGGGGSTTFLGLSDTPGSYSGQGNKVVRVKAVEDGLEFAAPTVHSHAQDRFTGPSGQQEFTFSQPVSGLEDIFLNGFEMDPSILTLTGVAPPYNVLRLHVPLRSTGVIIANYQPA